MRAFDLLEDFDRLLGVGNRLARCAIDHLDRGKLGQSPFPVRKESSVSKPHA
jgi:hypothetical protein